MDLKKFSNEFTTFQLISKSCNRLQCFGNRLPVPLNVEIQIQMWRVTSFHIKALCNRLHLFGNRLPVTISEKIKRCNSSKGFWLFQIGFKFSKSYTSSKWSSWPEMKSLLKQGFVLHFNNLEYLSNQSLDNKLLPIDF